MLIVEEEWHTIHNEGFFLGSSLLVIAVWLRLHAVSLDFVWLWSRHQDFLQGEEVLTVRAIRWVFSYFAAIEDGLKLSCFLGLLSGLLF